MRSIGVNLLVEQCALLYVFFLNGQGVGLMKHVC